MSDHDDSALRHFRARTSNLCAYKPQDVRIFGITHYERKPAPTFDAVAYRYVGSSPHVSKYNKLNNRRTIQRLMQDGEF